MHVIAALCNGMVKPRDMPEFLIVFSGKMSRMTTECIEWIQISDNVRTGVTMKISTKGRYALRMLIDLALHKNDGYVALKDIANRQDISKKYLEQIVPLLSKTGLLRANRGYQGGYMLAKTPDKYTVGEILRITEGSLAPVACLEQDVNDCARAADCVTLPVWEGLYKVITDYLDGITLQELIDKSPSANGNDYCI